MSFRLKTILGVALIEAVLLSLLVISGIYYLRSSNEAQLAERARTTARLIASMTSDAVVATDLATLDALVEQAIRNPGMVYVRVRSQNGLVLSQDGDARALASDFEPDPDTTDHDNDGRFDTSYPVEIAGMTFATVELGMSTSQLSGVIGDALRWMGAVAVTEMVLVGVLGWFLGTYLVRQLESLREGARRVADGDFGRQISVLGQDELAETAESFNQMSTALAQFAEEQRRAREQAELRSEQAEAMLADAVASMPDGMAIANWAGELVHANAAFQRNHPDLDFGAGKTMVLPDNPHSVRPDQTPSEAATEPRVAIQLSDGRHLLVARHETDTGGVVMVETDVTALREAEERSRSLERGLLQAQKMESLGTLAAGIAHEINTPIQFIGDNLRFLGTLVEETLENEAAIPHLPDDFSDEAESAIQESLEGVERVRDIVASMRVFAHPDSKDAEPCDINEAVRVTSNISRNRWKYCADLDLDLADHLPLVLCRQGEINQVFLNLITNAADAIEMRPEPANPGRIVIATSLRDHTVAISVSDNGLGIPSEARERIFDMFYTSKPPGKGTGQGLAICQSIIAAHDGRIEVASEPGKGTTFTVFLPVTN